MDVTTQNPDLCFFKSAIPSLPTAEYLLPGVRLPDV